MPRSFIAIEVPETIRNKIYESFASVRRQTSGVKWVEPAGMHLTLRFLGEVGEAILEKEIIPRISQLTIQNPVLHLEIGGVGLFPSVYKPRVFWVGMGGDVVSLKRLQGSLEQALAGLPIHEESKEFHAHLTLGRIKVLENKKVWQRVLEEYEKIDFGSFTADRVILFKSELTRKGAVYSKLREFQLSEV
jgi:2'-5' RNA ligase